VSLAVVLALPWAGPLRAQARSVAFLPRQIQPVVVTGQDRDAQGQPPIARMAGLGLLGGVVAGAAVAIPFYLALDDSDCEVCTGLVIAIPAVFLAYSAGQAVGVHLGNGRRGNFLADLGVSLLATAAGAGLGALADPDAALLGAAVGLGATVWMEARTSR
jgi:hypothetical protein